MNIITINSLDHALFYTLFFLLFLAFIYLSLLAPPIWWIQ